MVDVPPSASEHPPVWKFGCPVYHPATRVAWRAWLQAHQNDTPGVWVVSWRSSAALARVSYDAIVEEALCFGWDRLDGQRPRRGSPDAARHARRPRSTWAPSNKKRVARLEADDLAAALDRQPAARQAWDGFPPSAHKQMLFWVVSAAKQETRRRRIDTIVAAAARGTRARG